MSKRRPRVETVNPAPDLRKFTIDYFNFFGASVRPLDRRKQGPLEVRDLSPDLAAHFGKDQLALGFHNVPPGGEMELVAHGSRLFDRMLQLLERHGALTVQQLPSRFPASHDLLEAVRPLNAAIAGLKMHEQMQSLYLFNWRITYRADDKREELFSVALDDEGRRVPLSGEGDDPDAVDVEALWADAQPLPPETDADGQPLPPKLPPMTQLTRLAETARKYAIYHADVRCVSHEAEILPRLYQALNRLTTYYGQQIEEVYDSHDLDGEKRRALELDLERKLAEEVENHRLRVQVTLVSYALLQTPVAVAEMTLSDGARQVPLRVWRNRYSGAIQRPACHACGNAMSAVALDRAGHLCCDDCIRQCATCHEIVCAECGVSPCPVCGKENCDSCGRACMACGEVACDEHHQRCPVCGDDVCLACMEACAVCGERQCRSHLRADAVAAADGTHPLVCSDCAVRCPACHQFSAQTGVCDASGQRFCANCLVVCEACGKRVGPGFYQQDQASGAARCLDCLVVCPTCGAQTTTIIPCSRCGREGCRACMQRCDACHTLQCAEHLAVQAECGHRLCPDHVATCHIGGEAVCLVCDETCPGCDKPVCTEHQRVCRRCDQLYCETCMEKSGICSTCASLDERGVAVRADREAWAKLPEVAELVTHYRWRRVTNHRFNIYVGDGVFATRIVVVTSRDKKPRLVTLRRFGMEERLRDILGFLDIPPGWRPRG